MSNTNANEFSVPYNAYGDVVSVDVSNIPNGKKLFIFTSARVSWNGDSITFNWNITNQNNSNLAGPSGYIPGQTWGFVPTLTKIITKNSNITSVKLRFQKQDNKSNPKINAGEAVLIVMVID